MDQAEIDQFVQNGRSALTVFASGQEALDRWREAFEARGGAAVYGDSALEIVYFANDLGEFMTPAHSATVSKLRTDI